MADEPMKITDRRSAARTSSRLIVPTAAQTTAAMRGRLPAGGIDVQGIGDSNRLSRQGQGTDGVLDEMRRNRRVAALQKRGSGTGGVGGSYGADMTMATGRPRDPMFYWRQNNIPYDVTKDDELKKVRAFCRILYMTHPIVAACIDIFSKFPLQGMDFECKDDQLTDFYGALFFDELDYKNYLLDIGREYWITGEAWPLGSWNEVLGVWEDEELLQPDDVEVERSPFLKDPRYLIRLPETLRKVLQERSPRWEYDALMRSYPELAAYAGENSLMPVSNVLLKQLKFKGDTFHKRGLPILMRGFRAIVQEEMLNAAMDAIADRLYTPLILVKLGASATDLGTQTPWIPTPSDLEDFNESLDAALAGDFRILTHHFATDMAPVFGRENMPDMSGDFDRIEDRILQVFGLSRTMLSGADSGETYAADALNRDIVTQLLTQYQNMLKGFYTERALIVAEAQEHFDYDVRNGQRYVKMEEIYEVDEETGEGRIVEQPKLLIPDLKFDTMTLSDETNERQFREALVATGVPIPISKRIIGTGWKFEELVEEQTSERVTLALAEQETRKQIYEALRDANVRIPQDLLTDFQPKAVQGQMPHVHTPGQDMPIPAMDQPQDTPVLAPTPDEMGGEDMQDGQAPPGATAPMGQVIQMPPPNRPPESDEQRDGMPKPAKKRAPALAKNAVQTGIREATRKHYTAPDNSIEDLHDDNGDVVKARPENYRPTGKFGPPRHIGMRRHVAIAESAKADPEWDEEIV